MVTLFYQTAIDHVYFYEIEFAKLIIRYPLEGSGALMEQHVHTVEGVATCFLCGAQEQGFPWVVDDVAHHQTRMEEGGIRDQGSVCVGSHAYGGGVDEYVGLVQTVPERSAVRQIKETDPAVAAGMDPLDFLGD